MTRTNTAYKVAFSLQKALRLERQRVVRLRRIIKVLADHINTEQVQVGIPLDHNQLVRETMLDQAVKKGDLTEKEWSIWRPE